MKLFLDAGHNDRGHDTGASGNELREQDVTFSLAQRVGSALQAAGLSVAYSRTQRTDVLGANLNSSLNQRAQMANQWGADYFVSLHCNAGGTGKKSGRGAAFPAGKSAEGGTGAETYCLAAGGQAERLAKAVQAHLVAQTGLADRGVKTANFAVLRKTNMPAILVECGFIDHPADAALMKDGQGRIAGGIAQGILQHIGVKGGTQVDYISPTEAIAVLEQRGIISQPQTWYDGTWTDEDFKWLLRKMGTYLKLH